MSNTPLAMVLKFLVALALFAMWGYLEIAHVTLVSDYIDFIKYVLTALAAHMLTAGAPTLPTPPVLPQPSSTK